MDEQTNTPRICLCTGCNIPTSGKSHYCSNACKQKEYRIRNGKQEVLEDERFDPVTGEMFKPKRSVHKHKTRDSYLRANNKGIVGVAKLKAAEIHQSITKSNAAALDTMRRIAFAAAGLDDKINSKYRNGLRSALTMRNQLKPCRSGIIHVATPALKSNDPAVRDLHQECLRKAQKRIKAMAARFFYLEDFNNKTAAEMLNEFCRKVFGMDIIAFCRDAKNYSIRRFNRLFKAAKADIVSTFVFSAQEIAGETMLTLSRSTEQAERFAGDPKYSKLFLENERIIVAGCFKQFGMFAKNQAPDHSGLHY